MTKAKLPPKQASKPSLPRRIWRWAKRIFLFLFLAQFVYIVLLKWIDPPITLTQLGSWISGDGLKRDYVDDVSPNLKLAVMASEDQLFPDHAGFDWKHIKKAMDHNEKQPGRTIRGGSSISQQTAKNVFLWQGGGYIRKGLEAYFTKMIEWVWGKQRILEVYVNVIEMGRGIYGAEAAAQTYFGKAAKNLTRKEAAMIAACLPNPKVYTVKPVSAHVAARQDDIQVQMNYLQKDSAVQAVLKPPTP